MTEITKKSIVDVFDRAEQWPKAMGKLLLRDKSDRRTPSNGLLIHTPIRKSSVH